MSELFRIIRGLGGNGGTFLARAVAAIKNVVILSETNPRSANLFSFGLNPAYQIERHYRRLAFPVYLGHQAELGSPQLFRRYILGLRDQCAARGLCLVIRDYNYADYIGAPFVWPAIGKSSLDFSLGSDVEKLDVVIIRHPVTQFLSLRAHKPLQRALTVNAFLRGYRTLLDVHGNATVFRYEDIFGAFDNRFPALLSALRLERDPKWEERLPLVTWIRGNEEGRAKNVPEKPSDPLSGVEASLREEFLSDESYRNVCDRCQYES